MSGTATVNIRSNDDRVWSLSSVPRPVREIVEFALKGQDLTTADGQKFIKSISRIALAIIGSVALFYVGVPFASVLGAGVLVSFPAVLLVAGGYGVYMGSVLLVGSVSSASLMAVGIGFATLVAGWLCLEGHDVVGLPGLGEFVSDVIASVGGSSLINLIKEVPGK